MNTREQQTNSTTYMGFVVEKIPSTDEMWLKAPGMKFELQFITVLLLFVKLFCPRSMKLLTRLAGKFFTLNISDK